MTTNKKTEQKLNKASNTVKAEHAKMKDALHPLTPDARAETLRPRTAVLEAMPSLTAALELTGLKLPDVDLEAMQANAARAAAFMPLAQALRDWLDDVEDSILHAQSAAWRDLLVAYRAVAGVAESDAAVHKALSPMTEAFRAGQPRKAKTRAAAANEDQPVPATVEKPTGT